MTQQEIVRRYLSDDQRYIRRCTIESKDLLYQILKVYSKVNMAMDYQYYGQFQNKKNCLAIQNQIYLLGVN